MKKGNYLYTNLKKLQHVLRQLYLENVTVMSTTITHFVVVIYSYSSPPANVRT
jgi:hypothetical protein